MNAHIGQPVPSPKPLLDKVRVPADLRALPESDMKQLAEELRRELAPMLEQLESKQSVQKLEIVAFGAISSGKSAE